MKKLFLFISAAMIGFLVILSCNTTEPTPPVDYTYSISKVFWTDSVDNNKDGYTTNRTLWLHLNLEEDVNRTVVAELYFRSVGATNYSYYGSTPELEIEGINSPLTVQLSLGAPMRELLYGVYDFRVEIYEVNSSRLEASIDMDDEIGADLGGQSFESLATDQIYSINLWWQNPVDINQNGYNRKVELMIDVNLEQDVTKTIYTELYAKEKNAEEYSLYNKSENYSITGNNLDDTLKIVVGEPPLELVYGEYDFKITVYEQNIWFPVAYLDVDSDDPLADSLKGKKFEAQVDDGYFYTINNSSLEWKDEVDSNANGYTSFRKLFLDVNVDKNETRLIWAKVYYQHEDSAQSRLYSDYFKLLGQPITAQNSDDKIALNIGELTDSTKLLYKGKYNFLVNIFEWGDTMAVASIGSDTSAVLRFQQFETATEDTL